MALEGTITWHTSPKQASLFRRHGEKVGPSKLLSTPSPTLKTNIKCLCASAGSQDSVPALKVMNSSILGPSNAGDWRLGRITSRLLLMPCLGRITSSNLHKGIMLQRAALHKGSADGRSTGMAKQGQAELFPAKDPTILHSFLGPAQRMVRRVLAQPATMNASPTLLVLSWLVVQVAVREEEANGSQ